jgi:uncharacterized protein DUF397
MDHVSTTTWRKSSHSSGNGGQCVELAVVEAQADAAIARSHMASE